MRAGRRTPRRIGLIALLAAAASLGAVSVAVAFWTGTGTGAGSGATAASAQTVALGPASPAASLYPGGRSDVALRITNPNSFAVRVGSLSLATSQGTGGFAVDPAHAGCDLAALAFATQSNGATGWTVPGKVGSTDGSLAVDLPNALAMGPAASNACQGAGFTVYLTAGP